MKPSMPKLSVNIFRPSASNMVRTKERKRMTPITKSVAEFFAGIGLVRAALEAEGWNVSFANDIDPHKHSTYRRNFGDSDFVLGDIRKLKAENVPTVLMATASFPCTDLSLAGARQGLNGSESGTLWSFLHIIEAMGERSPKLLLLENVSGFLSSHGGKDFEAAVKRLNDLGYVCDVTLLNAAHFTPQSRQRLFLVACKADVPIPYETLSIPSLLTSHPARPEQLIRAVKPLAHLRWRFARFLPNLNGCPQTVNDIMEQIPSDSSLWWDSKRTAHLLGQLSKRHAAVVAELRAGKKEVWATVYKRMRGDDIRAEVRCDGIAGCLRTPRGGSSRQIVMRLGKNNLRVRHMTPREYGRLQGVDDSFKIDDNVINALFGFGDAVCVPAVRWVAQQLINPIADNLTKVSIERQRRTENAIN